MSNLPKESSLEGPDILIVTMPKVEPDAPTIGPSLLKSHLLANGFSCETLDLNIKLYNHLKKKGLEHHYYRENDIVFALREGTYSAEFLEFFAAESEFFKAWVSSIKARRPKVVGLSFLTSFSNAVGFKFSEMLREEMPEVAILWGGPQVGIEIDLAKIEATCDHHISGDAENAVVDFMRSLHDSEPFEDRGAVQLEDLKGVLLPDYSDVDWSEYYSHKNFADMAYVTATRGCVKACSFCNVYKIWPKYLMRPTGGVADEIKLLIEDHGRKSIYFTDSLLNGSRKHFRNLMSEMKVLKQEQPDLKWEAQWVLKPRHIMPEDDFQLLSDTGCHRLSIGVESFTPHVREHMGKHFCNEDLLWTLDQLAEREILSSLLMIVGYPTETEQDHQYTLEMIRLLYESGYAKRTNAAGEKLVILSFSSTLMLSKNEKLYNSIQDGLTEYVDDFNWTYKDNSLSVRIRRYNEIMNLIDEMQSTPVRNWSIERSLAEHQKLLNKHFESSHASGAK